MACPPLTGMKHSPLPQAIFSRLRSLFRSLVLYQMIFSPSYMANPRRLVATSRFLPATPTAVGSGGKSRSMRSV